MDETSSTPDLQTILANLAQFAHQASARGTCAPIDRIEPTTAGQVAYKEHGELIAPERHIDKSEPRPQSRPTTSAPPLIDPATITTWQDGLRCVTKIAAQNAQFAASIRKLMEEQRRSELRWYAERQALKQAQANRSKTSAEAQSILQSLSGDTPSGATQQRTVDSEAELAALDRKIYDAQVDMHVTMTSNLKGLGVPFFGTEKHLINEDVSASSGAGFRPKWSPNIAKNDLQALQKRMIQHLEDLYRD